MPDSLLEINEKLCERLNEAIASNSVFHAYIIESGDKQEGEVFAKAFIKAMLTHSEIGKSPDNSLCHRIDGDRHEDVIVIRKDGASTKIKQIRDMQARIAIRPLGERYVVLIVDGDEMVPEAQNALLKTLEEPPGNSMIIVISENTENLLPTVKSRCIICNLEQVESADPEELRQAAENMLELASGGAPYYKLIREGRKAGENRDDLRKFIDIAEELCRDRLFARDNKGMPFRYEETGEAIHALEDARHKLDRGLNPKYVLKDLILRIGG